MKRALSLLLVIALAASLVIALPAAGASAAGYTPPALKVAVVSSGVSQAWLNMHAPTFGYGQTQWRADVTYNWLANHGWDVTKVNDTVFNSLSSLKAYDVVVLPYVFCMNTTPSRNLQQYVKEGGGVVALLGSPRINTEYEKGPTTEYPEHWVTILDTRAMEWGPMTDVYQQLFINDPGAPRYKNVTWPFGNQSPVLAGARNILSARGLSSSSLQLDRAFSGAVGGGFELCTFVKNNNNVQPIYSFVINTGQDSKLKQYPGLNTAGNYPSAVSTKYYAGRSVYYDFCLADFLRMPADGDWYGGIAGHAAPSGVAQREIAGAMLESSVAWAGADHTDTGSINRDGRTWATINVYQDGIYAFQYIGVFGNVSLSGKATFRIYDPSGRLVFAKTHGAPYNGNFPGGTANRLNWQYRPGPLKSGKYKVEVEYVFGYPQMDKRYKEVAYVVKGQGVGIKTVHVVSPTKAPTISKAYFAPKPITPNGDGWMDWGYATYSTDQPANVSTKIYTLNWVYKAIPENNVYRLPGRYSVRFDGAGLPDGAYRYSQQATNELGKGSSGGYLYINHRLTKAPALGSSPSVTGLAAQPQTFASKTDITFMLSDRAWVTSKVFGPTGAEVRMLANNNLKSAGTQVLPWDGKDGSGRLLANGSYRYYVFASSGGNTPKTQFVDGAVTIAR